MIGHGERAWAREFLRETGTPFPVFVDPDRSAYRAFAWRRDPWSLLRPSLWLNSFRAWRAGHRQTGLRGDGFQNGGVVVVAPDGTVRFRHDEAVAGDPVDLDALERSLAS